MTITDLLTFRRLAASSAVLAASLAAALTFVPEVFHWMWNLGPSEVGTFFGRRAGALFGGFAAILYLVRAHGENPSRSALAAGFAIACAWLAILGVMAYMSGLVGPGMGLAVVVEVLLAAAFARFARWRSV